jgi:hypothetical protein
VTGAGGKEVGRVSIRVVPNLKLFREELKEELEKWERKTVDIQARLKDSGDQLNKDISEATKNLTADVDAGLKDSGNKLNKELQEATKGSTVAVDAKTGKTDKLTKGIEKAAKSVKAKTDVELDLDRFTRRYRNKFQALMSEFEANLPLTVDNEVIREGLIDAEKEFNEKLRLLDPKKDQETLAKLRQEVEKFYREARDFGYGDNLLTKEIRSQVKLDFDVANAKRELAEFKKKVDDDFAEFKRLEFFSKLGQQKLEITLRPKIELSAINKIDWDKIGLGRSLAILGGGSLKFASDGLYKIGSAAINAGKAFVRLGQNGMIAVAVLALIAPALALVSGALVATPAAFAALTVPIAAIALGLDGIKKAAESVKPQFEELRAVMSQSFETGFTPIFKDLADNLIPSLKKSLPSVSQGLTELFGGLTKTVTDPGNLGKIENTIENIGKALGRAKQGAQDFASGLIQLVSELSNKFPGLADAFNRTGKSFLEWVDKITTKDPITNVSQLDTAMTQLGDTLSRLGGLVTTFFQSGWENLTNVDFGKSMSGFVDSVDRLVNVTLPALANAFQGIATALKPIVAVVEAIDAVLDRLGARLPQSAQQMGDALSGFASPNKLLLGDKLGGWIDELTGNEYSSKARAAGEKLAVDLSEGLAQGLDAGARIGTDIFNMDEVGAAVSQQIKQAITVSKEDQAQALRSAFTAGGVDSAVSQQLTQQVTAAVQGAKNAMANLGPELQGLIDAALMPLATIADRVGEAFSTMGPTINNAFIGAMAGVRDTITGLFGFLALSIGTQTSKISNSIGQAFQGAPQQVGAALAGVPGAVAGALAPAIAAAANAAVGMLQAMNAGLAALPAVVQAWFGAVPATVQGAMSPAIGTVASVCQQIVSTMLSFAGAAEQAGTAIGASFAKGIASATNLVISSASALMNAARAFFPSSPAEKGPFSGSGWVDNSGKAVGEGFAAGMQSSVGGVVDIARVMMQQVKDVFGNAEGLVINFNFNQVAQPISQFSNSIAGIGTSMAGALPAAQEFQQTLGQTGQSLAMLDSSQSKGRIEELKKSLLELEIQRKQLEAARDMPGADQAAIKAQIEQIRNQKNLLGLERDKLTYAQKYGGQMSSTAQSYKEQMNSLQQIPFDFATATSNQFMSDLGWSGQGAIPSLMQQGMDFGTNFIFNVANMDDALSGQRVLQNRTAQATLGR